MENGSNESDEEFMGIAVWLMMYVSGTQNYSGQQVFDCVPAQGLIESGKFVPGASMRGRLGLLVAVVLTLAKSSANSVITGQSQVLYMSPQVVISHFWLDFPTLVFM